VVYVIYLFTYFYICNICDLINSLIPVAARCKA